MVTSLGSACKSSCGCRRPQTPPLLDQYQYRSSNRYCYHAYCCRCRCRHCCLAIDSLVTCQSLATTLLPQMRSFLIVLFGYHAEPCDLTPRQVVDLQTVSIVRQSRSRRACLANCEVVYIISTASVFILILFLSLHHQQCNTSITTFTPLRYLFASPHICVPASYKSFYGTPLPPDLPHHDTSTPMPVCTYPILQY